MSRIVEEIILKVVLDDSRAKKGLDNINQSTKEADKSAKSLRQTLRAIGAGSIAFGLFRVAKATTETAAQFDSLDASLKSTLGTATQAADELDFLRETSDKLGLNLLKTGQSYAKFIAATKGTGIDLEQSREIFLGISEAGTALGLSADDVAGSLRAVQQIASKGRVSLEELTGQLGERLPRATQLLADEMGITRKELIKMAESGELMAEDILPSLGRALRQAFSKDALDAASNTRAELNRLSNEWNDLKNTIGESAAQGIPLATRAIKGLDGLLQAANGNLDKSIDKLSTFGQLLGGLAQGFRNPVKEWMDFFRGEVIFSAEEVAESLKPVPEAIKFANRELDEMGNKLSKVNIFANDISDLFTKEFEISGFDKLTESRLETARTILGLTEKQFKSISKTLKEAFKQAGGDTEKVGAVFERIFDLADDKDFMKRFENFAKPGEGFFSAIFGDIRKQAMEMKSVFTQVREDFNTAFKDLDLAKQINLDPASFGRFQSFLRRAREQFGEEFIEKEVKRLNEEGFFGKPEDKATLEGGSAAAVSATTGISQFLKANRLAIANAENARRSADSLEAIERELKQNGFRAFGGRI